MEKKNVSSCCSVELLDKDVNSGGQHKLKSENCDDENGCTVYNGKSTDADLSSTIRSHLQGTQQQQNQHRSADRKTFKRVAADQEVMVHDANANRHQSIARKSSSLCCGMNSTQLTGNLEHEGDHMQIISEYADVFQPPHDLLVPESSSGCETIFYCSKCGRRFTKLDNFLRHSELNLNCSVRCSTCRKPFEDLSALQKHRVTHHLSSADKRSSLQQLTPPKLEKAAQYVCSECGRVFKTSTTLNTHVLTHTGERPVVCRVAGCNKRFTQHSTRAFHERTHSDDMPYICAVCGRRFKHAIGVRLHMGVHTGCKTHRCASCPMVFRRSCDLQRHSRTHTGERPFSCPNCQKSFKTRKTLSCHILALHTDQFPWRCSVCDKGFKTSGNLHVHLRVHTGDKPYICAVCGIRYAYSTSLKLHMQAHAGSEGD